MNRSLILPALIGSLAVILGAFGAHALEGRLDERAIEVWQTANRYHFFHALALLALKLACLNGLQQTRGSVTAWLVGLTLFSGSLYVYALSGLKFAAMLAPIGGLSLACGWLLLLRVKVAS